MSSFRVAVKFEFEGVSELYRALKDADVKLAKKTMKKAITQGNKLILKDAKAFVPTQTKTLKKALGSKVKVMKGGGVVVGIVGPRKDAKGKPPKYRRKVKVTTRYGMKEMYRNPVKYAHLVEKGTRPHTLGKGSTLNRKTSRGTVIPLVQRGNKHPGAVPKPFLRPALEKNRAQVRDVIADTLRQALNSLGRAV